MSQNYYLNEKLAEVHRQDLLREAEQQRLVATLPRQQNNGVAYRAVTYGWLVLVPVLVIATALMVHFVGGSSLHQTAVVHWDQQAFLYHLTAWRYGAQTV
jgi:hypothetical protein